MEIKVFDTLPSTQKYLINEIKNNLDNEICIVALHQSDGIGSRNNYWNSVEKGLYFSFSKKLNNLPDDLKLESISIFFGFIFKELLVLNGSKVWLKYPNDLYINDNKVGGIICNIVNDFVICGIGLNIESNTFACIENNIVNDIYSFLKNYFDNINTYNWKDVFNKYKIEFYRNYPYNFHYKDKIISFKDARLLYDGSININGQIIYSFR